MATVKKARKSAKLGARPSGRKRVLPAADGEAGEGGTESKQEIVRRLLAQIETKLKHETGKATVADFIRLLQLERELSEEEAREVVVRWVEPGPEPSEE